MIPENIAELKGNVAYIAGITRSLLNRWDDLPLPEKIQLLKHIESEAVVLINQLETIQ